MFLCPIVFYILNGKSLLLQVCLSVRLSANFHLACNF